MGFDLSSKRRRELGHQLIDHIDTYFSSLPERAVQLPAAQRRFDSLSGPLPETGDDPTKVLDEICGELIEKGFHVPSANYFGLMNPTPSYAAVLAEALVAALNPQLASLARSQYASKIEAETVRWIGERVGWPGEFSGTFTSGGNEANFSGLALALASAFPDAIENGIASAGGPPVAYASSEAHHSLDKSAGLLGIGRKGLQRLAVNSSLQLAPEALLGAIEKDLQLGNRPFCVVATAGTTSTGTVDDVPMLAKICRRYGLWLHVDGAYGAAAIFSNTHRGLVKGIEQADSVTIDPHKWLAMPFAAGVFLTSRPEILARTFSVAAPYMPKSKNVAQLDNSRIGAQWSRRMNSLKLWLTLRVHGRAAYEELIDRQITLARNFATWVEQSPYFELAAPQVLPIVAFRLKSSVCASHELADAHSQIIEQVTQEGKRWISETMANGRSAIRMMIISYLTEETHVRGLENALTEAAVALSTDVDLRAG